MVGTLVAATALALGSHSPTIPGNAYALVQLTPAALCVETVPLLQAHLQRCGGRRLSEDTIRRQLDRLGYVWKRFRYVLPPDPEREKKTRHPAAAAGLAAAQRQVG